MTDVTKILISNLLKGCTIYGHQRGFLLRGTENNFLQKINPRTYRQVRYYLRKDKKTGLFMIDKRVVRKERNNSWIKQQYKTNAAKQNHTA